MIVADSSTWVAYLTRGSGEDVVRLDKALVDGQVLMAPAVLAQLISDAKLLPEVVKSLLEVPLIEIEPGYWQRVGALRAKVLATKRRARLGDALIAQSCIDRRVSLLTRDRDFRTFAEVGGLDLVI